MVTAVREKRRAISLMWSGKNNLFVLIIVLRSGPFVNTMRSFYPSGIASPSKRPMMVVLVVICYQRVVTLPTNNNNYSLHSIGFRDECLHPVSCRYIFVHLRCTRHGPDLFNIITMHVLVPTQTGRRYITRASRSAFFFYLFFLFVFNSYYYYA